MVKNGQASRSQQARFCSANKRFGIGINTHSELYKWLFVRIEWSWQLSYIASCIRRTLGVQSSPTMMRFEEEDSEEKLMVP
jgi:hypothetical protein